MTRFARLVSFATALLLAAPAAAQERATTAPASTSDVDEVPPPPPAQDDLALTDAPTEWTFEQLRFRSAVFEQRGSGLQSQAADDSADRGSEELWVAQPILYFRLRQSENIVHDVTIPVDIVTAASTDALDAISRASLLNEATTANVQTSIDGGEDTTYQWSWGGHFEENFWSGTIGGGLVQEMADDNAVLRTNVQLILDTFDPVNHNGIDLGFAHRFTANANISLSQLLSPTTVAFLSYGFTYQTGRLETTWNSVPRMAGGRVQDNWPEHRYRHTFRGEIRQAVPDTGTTFAASYRFYFDSFDIQAHSLDGTVTQMIGDIWLRGRYRFHTQNAPSFWTTSFDGDNNDEGFRTADSDLEALNANEIALSLRWFYDRYGALTGQSSFFQIGHLWYWRTNDMSVNIMSLDWGQQF